MFQTKCKNLEEMMNKREEESVENVKKLRRENQLLSDKHENQEKALHDLKDQIEEMMNQKKDDITKLKKEHET